MPITWLVETLLVMVIVTSVTPSAVNRKRSDAGMPGFWALRDITYITYVSQHTHTHTRTSRQRQAMGGNEVGLSCFGGRFGGQQTRPWGIARP